MYLAENFAQAALSDQMHCLNEFATRRTRILAASFEALSHKDL
jgi:hypothetical protein